MGLDMYLSAEKYVGGWKHVREHDKPDIRAEATLYDRLLDDIGLRDAASLDSPSATIRVTVAYWRKANAIHQWFVENVQNGTDDCGDYYVSHEQLRELRDLCAQVLAVAKVADNQPVHSGTTYYPGGRVEDHFEDGRAALNGQELAELLPTQSGFFFGNTDYDEWYLRSVEDTIRQIDKVLATVPDTYELYYHSSW